MDKNAIKKYAIWARNELIAKISQKALLYGISEDGWSDINADEVNGIILSATEKKQRKALIEQIQAKGYKNVIEEAAYTWFNRFVALRYMEVNNYLPSHTHIFSSTDGTEKDGYDIFKPQVLDEALELELDGLDRSRIIAYKEENKTEELYKYILVTQCNALNSILPHIFQKLTDYTELLLPDYLLRKNAGGEKGSVLNELVTTIPKADWQDQVQIIGWLYQYYNTEPKDKVFANLKKNIKVSKENIPAATQLFTPDWIVRYMVENSLGRLWLEGHPNEELQNGWKYYLEEAEQESEVAEKLAELRKERTKVEPKDIRIIDPCMGSGHILVYAFDVLMEIYSKYGVNRREAVKSIITNNLYGLDIDQRAFQLAYFAIMMKGRQYDPRFFTRGAVPQVYAIEESNVMQKWGVVGSAKCLVDNENLGVSEEFIKLTDELIYTFHDAKEYGSLLEVNSGQWVIDRSEIADDCLDADNSVLVITEELDKIKEHFAGDLFAEHDINLWCDSILDLAKQTKVMSQKYDVCVTNPPYMGLASGDKKINEYVKKNYPDSKTDLYAVFIEKCGEMLQDNGYQAMITQQSWMFLSSFEKLRKKIFKKQIVNMAHLGTRAFDEIGGEVVQTTSFVLRNNSADKYKGTYARLIEANSETTKKEMFLNGENRFVAESDNFEKIPGSPVAYWVSDNIRNAFRNNNLEKFGIAKAGLSTGNNDKYLKLWFEISINDIGFEYNSNEEYELGDKGFVPCNKGGSFRRWYGNFEYVVDWSRRSEFHRARTTYMNLYYKQAITWSVITSSLFNGRYYPKGFLFDHAAASFFAHNNENVNIILGYINTTVFQNLLHMINPTINTGTDVVLSIPLLIHEKNDTISELVEENISLSRIDWDIFETSWDFEVNPLVLSHNLTSKPIMIGGRDIRKGTFTLEEHYKIYKTNTNGRFRQLKENEEELNEIFIDIYGLQDELTPKVANKDVTIAFIFDTKEDILESFKGNNYVLTREDVIKNLISYAVGCMFGRYSTNPEHYGLVYAGGDGWQEAMQAYTAEEIARGIPDADAILPICTDNYLDDDITSLFVAWLGFTFGAEHLEENLTFIAESLSTKGNTSKEVIRNYFINDFYKDHVKKYQKRPIYWLFDSGKNNGFKALIYMHRYKPDTIARVRTDYVHELQSRYRTAIENLENQIASASGGTSVKLKKKLKELNAQADEAHVYEEKIHHLADQMIAIDLDDGVKVNYAKFQDVLAKIK